MGNLLESNILLSQDFINYVNNLSEEKQILNELDVKSLKSKTMNGIDKAKSVKMKADKASNDFKNLTRKLYTADEKHLLANRPLLSKTITRGIILICIFSIPVVGPLASIIAYFTDKYLSEKISITERKKLYNMYIAKLDQIEEKMGNVNELEEQKLKSLKNELLKNAKKLKVYIDNEKDSKRGED